jgi:hypothetical protein
MPVLGPKKRGLGVTIHCDSSTEEGRQQLRWLYDMKVLSTAGYEALLEAAGEAAHRGVH